MTRSSAVSIVILSVAALVLHSAIASRDDELREASAAKEGAHSLELSSGTHMVSQSKNASTLSEVHAHDQELQPPPALPSETEDAGNPVITPEQREQLKEFSKMAVEALSQTSNSSLSPQEKQQAVHDALNKAASVMISLSAGIDMKKHPEMEKKLQALKTMTSVMRAKAHGEVEHSKALGEASAAHEDEKAASTDA